MMNKRTFPTTMSMFACVLAFGHGSVLLAAEPKAFLESATIVGADETLVLSRVPVRTSAGKIIYKDVSMDFAVETTGALVLDLGSVTVTNSPTLTTGTFKPGIYTTSNTAVCPSTGCIVATPGVPPGGRVMTSLSGAANIFESLSWASGPVAGHPYEGALKKARITNNSMTWGIVGSANSNGCFYQGHVIGAVQTGNQLTLTNFGVDNIPDCSIVFNKKP